jgi:hypothetical protein
VKRAHPSEADDPEAHVSPRHARPPLPALCPWRRNPTRSDQIKRFRPGAVS